VHEWTHKYNSFFGFEKDAGDLSVLVFFRVMCHGANLYHMSGHERNALFYVVTSVRNEVVESLGFIA